MSSNKRRKTNANDENCIAVEKCSFGAYLHKDCHRNFKSEIVPLLNFSEQDQILFQWRSGFNQSDPSASTICNYHKYKFGDGLEKQLTKCCNTYKTCKKVKGGHLVTFEIAVLLKKQGKKCYSWLAILLFML